MDDTDEHRLPEPDDDAGWRRWEIERYGGYWADSGSGLGAFVAVPAQATAPATASADTLG